MIGLIIVGALILLVLASSFYFGWKIYKKDNGGEGVPCKPYNDWTECLPSGQVVGKETTFSKSIPAPATTLKIKNYSTVLKDSWCSKTKYALRYVTKDEEYGPLSVWSDSMRASPSTGCSSNILFLQLETDSAIDTSYPIVNIWRKYEKDDGKWSEPELIGSLYPIVYQYVDTDNPAPIGRCPSC